MNATKPNLVDYRRELMLFDFTNEQTVENWDCLSDTDVEGLSTATFKPNGKGIRQIMHMMVMETCIKARWLIGSGAVFSGELSTKLRPESVAKYGGYCAIRSKPKEVRSGTSVGSYVLLKANACINHCAARLVPEGNDRRIRVQCFGAKSKGRW